jgi:preprotein translocase subunit SecA
MLNLVKKLFGSKADRDYREVKPVVEQIHKAYENIKQLDNDQLRAKTSEFRQRISEYLKDEQQQIDELLQKVEGNYDIDIEEKEKIYAQVDVLEKQKDEKIESVLMEILVATRSPGIWCITMFSSLAAWCFTRVKLPKWQPVKVKPWLLPCRFI